MEQFPILCISYYFDGSIFYPVFIRGCIQNMDRVHGPPQQQKSSAFLPQYFHSNSFKLQFDREDTTSSRLLYPIVHEISPGHYFINEVYDTSLCFSWESTKHGPPPWTGSIKIWTRSMDPLIMDRVHGPSIFTSWGCTICYDLMTFYDMLCDYSSFGKPCTSLIAHHA